MLSSRANPPVADHGEALVGAGISPPAMRTSTGPRTKAGPSPRVGGANARGNRPQQWFPLQQLGQNDLILPWESSSLAARSFEARPGQVNEWTIPLTDELLEAVRKRLKEGAKVEKAE